MDTNDPPREMKLDRFSALSDGIFAVIITIMVLAIKIPDRYDSAALYTLWSDILSYAISYAFIAVVWMNHHFVFRYARKMTPMLAWSNFANLFWIALIPFASAWMAASKVSSLPVTIYSVVFLMVEGTYMVLMYDAFRQSKGSLQSGQIRQQWIRAWIMLGIFFLSATAWFLPSLMRLFLLTSFLVLHISPGLRRASNKDSTE